jgi:hypothetical protein
VNVPEAEPTSARAQPSSARQAPPTPSIVVDSDGVSDVRLGRAIPSHYLADARAARRSYEIRWVADGAPFEAFRLDEPAIIAAFQGPFTRWAESNAGELEPGRFVDEALREAQRGAPVESIVIEHGGAKTAAGIGIGSSFAELTTAYPDAKLLRLPEWFEPRATCSVSAPTLPRVSFHLSACRGDERGDVIRILVSR